MVIESKTTIALWVLTSNGLELARRLRASWPDAVVYCSRRIAPLNSAEKYTLFNGLAEAVTEDFHHFQGHVFIMATGIVVRCIARHLRHKTRDPAVVVVDDRGRFAISLVSGHVGGANRLAGEAAGVLGAVPVITTATDINARPAVDLLALALGLKIENPACIKTVNMALLEAAPVLLHDPGGWLGGKLPGAIAFNPDNVKDQAAVWVDDAIVDLDPRILVLRPPSLVAGIGCNRGTPLEEIRELLFRVMAQFALSRDSLGAISSIDVKSDEEGIRGLSAEMDLSLIFFTKEELARVEDVPTPSAMVAKHVGVPSVCEAAAILASRHGRLIVPKHHTRNVTVAIARRACTLSVSGRAA
jgi:cobalt-precorrin 5A hydrolase